MFNKPVPTRIHGGGYRIGFETTFTIKRSDFGMDFMMGGVGDEVRIIVSVEGERR